MNDILQHAGTNKSNLGRKIIHHKDKSSKQELLSKYFQFDAWHDCQIFNNNKPKTELPIFDFFFFLIRVGGSKMEIYGKRLYLL